MSQFIENNKQVGNLLWSNKIIDALLQINLPLILQRRSSESITQQFSAKMTESYLKLNT